MPGFIGNTPFGSNGEDPSDLEVCPECGHPLEGDEYEGFCSNADCEFAYDICEEVAGKRGRGLL